MPGILKHSYCARLWQNTYDVQINSYYLQLLVNLVSCSFSEWKILDFALKPDVGQLYSSGRFWFIGKVSHYKGK